MTEQEARDELRGVIVTGFNRHALGAGDADLSGYLADLLLAASYGKHPEPEWEFEVSYSSPDAPSIDGYRLRRTVAAADEAEAIAYASFLPGARIRKRTKAVPAGPWLPVGEGTENPTTNHTDGSTK